MTTIATDGKTMAADTERHARAFILQQDAIKMFRINGVVYGVAGDPACAEKYLGWVRMGCPKETEPSPDGEWVVTFVRFGKIWHVNSSLAPMEVGAPYAIGSGAEGAMAAMLCGKTPAQAIKIAMKLDGDTGGKVRTMKC